VALAVEQCVDSVLRWSWWRRWHQARARACHERRRQMRDAGGPSPSPAPAAPKQGAVTQEEVLERVWKRLVPLLAPRRRVGHPYVHDRRVVLEAIIHVMTTNCGWQHLPAHFPPWKTVYSQFADWRATGIWDRIWNGTSEAVLVEQLQL
jgi:transposase